MLQKNGRLLIERWNVMRVILRGVTILPGKESLAGTRLQILVNPLPYPGFQVQWLFGFSALLVTRDVSSEGDVSRIISGDLAIRWPDCLFQPHIILPPEAASLPGEVFRETTKGLEREQLARCRFFHEGRSNISHLILRNAKNERIVLRNSGFHISS